MDEETTPILEVEVEVEAVVALPNSLVEGGVLVPRSPLSEHRTDSNTSV